MKLIPEHHIQRLNQLNAQVEALQALPTSVQVSTSRKGQWSIVQIIQHLNLAYDAYRDRIDQLLAKLPDHEAPPILEARGIPGFFIRMIRPTNGKRKWKIKTLPRYQPGNPGPGFGSHAAVYEAFFQNQAHLKEAILASRHKDCTKGRLVSGIGPIVMFRFPECVEFLLSHADRHMVQADRVLEDSGFKASERI